MFIRLLLFALILPLVGCQTSDLAQKGDYVPPERSGGRMCVLQCRKALNRCKEGCSLSRRACYVKMQTLALKDYEAYTREQFRTRQPADLRMSDFERPKKCESTVCKDSCTPPYNICYEKCGGKVVGSPQPASLPY